MIIVRSVSKAKQKCVMVFRHVSCVLTTHALIQHPGTVKLLSGHVHQKMPMLLYFIVKVMLLFNNAVCNLDSFTTQL